MHPTAGRLPRCSATLAPAPEFCICATMYLFRQYYRGHRNGVFFPYPSFEGASPAVVQRGTGLFAVRSEDERKNKAAALFAHWITLGKDNVDFATQTGYLPVASEGMNALLADTGAVENERYRMLYDAVGDMHGGYLFCALPRCEGAADV